MEKETIILDFQVEQGSAIQELEKTKKIIVGLQQEQKELNAAYKAGNITLDEYVSEQVRLEAILKKQQSAYNNTQKSVTGVKTKMDDLIKSNQNLNKSLEEGLNNASVFGTNLGGLKNSFNALTSPVGIATGAISALGALYARSAAGAKDLEFAQNQLSAAFGIISNDLVELVGASEEDGRGLLSRFFNFFLEVNPLVGTLDRLGLTNIAEDSKEIALSIERLQDLQREEISIRGQVSDRLADNQELMSKIQDSQTDFNEKVSLTGEILTNLNKNEEDLLLIKRKQIEELAEQRKSAQDVEAIDTKILDIEREISNIQKDTERKIQSINRLTSNLSDAERKRLETIEKQNAAIAFQQSEAERERRIREFDKQFEGESDTFGTVEFVNQEIKLDNERVEVFRENTKKQEEELKKRSDAYNDYVKEQIQLTEDNFNTLAQLFSDGSDARRLFGLAAIGVDTAQAISALTAASEANPANAFTFGGAGIAQYAAGIIRILANIAAAKEFLGGEFAGGTQGKDFVTTKPTLLLVGDNPGNRERVTVEPLSGKGRTRVHKNSGLVAMAGGGSLTFDGARDVAVQAVQQNLQLRNSIKNLPAPEVSWREGEIVGKRVRFKESVSSR